MGSQMARTRLTRPGNRTFSRDNTIIGVPLILYHNEVTESETEVYTRYGRGTLHVTNLALVIIIRKRGIVFHRWHYQMAGIRARDARRMVVSWPEGGRIFTFEFRVRGADHIVSKIRKNHDYTGNQPAGKGHVSYTEQRQREIREKRKEWGMTILKSAQEQDTGNTDDVRMWRQFVLDSHKISYSRSTMIPGTIPDHLCWNDSWFDRDYYTFNRYWLDGTFAKAPIRGAQVDYSTGSYRIPVTSVGFFHGYPYARADAFVNPIYDMGFLIPTMTEAMLDDQMMAKRFRPRRRHDMGVGLDQVEPPAILGYLNVYSEATVKGYPGGDFTPKEAAFLDKHGLLSDEASSSLGLARPGREEIAAAFEEDDRLA